MKLLLPIALFCASLVASAAEPKSPAAESKVGSEKVGRMSTVRLLAIGRVADKEVPDGLRFMFLVTRVPGTTGGPTLKETRDFLLGGASYQEKTQAELGKKFEPSTVFDTAEGFLAKQSPRLRGAIDLSPAEIAGAHILTLAIGGAALPSDGRAKVMLHVGFGREVEPFTFEVKIPAR